MAMTPAALSLLGVEPLSRRRRNVHAERDMVLPDELHNVAEIRPMRPSRRATSYYNSFQTVCSTSDDQPPSYAIAARHQPAQRRHLDRRDVLPKYTCTVAAEGKLLLQLESVSPLDGVAESEWREVYAVLRGTLLSFHRPKENGPGKLLRSYTLQHAEVGLASDTQHTILVPQTRLAHLVPSAARRKAWQKDPDLFRPVRQHILRLRAETDQILLADASEDRIHSLIHAISAGIDISHAIDERSIPRQCTVPRRRRRQRHHHPEDLNDPALLAEQERILRDMYPTLAERTDESRPELERTFTTATNDIPSEPLSSPSREEDELDLAVIREDFATLGSPPPSQQDNSSSRPSVSRQITASSIDSAYSNDMMYATSPTNFDTSGKWQPPHTRTPQQISRYVRRCLPVLLADSSRASDILICSGRRFKLNWRMELMEEWELQPPSYKSHGFNNEPSLERTRSLSQNSASGSATQDNAQAFTSVLGAETDDQDQITRVESRLGNLDLSKLNSIGSNADKGTPGELPAQKSRDTRYPGTDSVHGVVFCF